MSITIRRTLVAGLASFVVYPLSYAPLQRLVNGPDKAYPRDGFSFSGAAGVFQKRYRLPPRGGWEAVYLPSRLLIDRTPLRGPLLLWGGLWGVEAQHRDR